jgi:hypothetical protein
MTGGERKLPARVFKPEGVFRLTRGYMYVIGLITIIVTIYKPTTMTYRRPTKDPASTRLIKHNRPLKYFEPPS